MEPTVKSRPWLISPLPFSKLENTACTTSSVFQDSRKNEQIRDDRVEWSTFTEICCFHHERFLGPHCLLRLENLSQNAEIHREFLSWCWSLKGLCQFLCKPSEIYRSRCEGKAFRDVCFGLQMSRKGLKTVRQARYWGLRMRMERTCFAAWGGGPVIHILLWEGGLGRYEIQRRRR